MMGRENSKTLWYGSLQCLDLWLQTHAIKSKGLQPAGEEANLIYRMMSLGKECCIFWSQNIALWDLGKQLLQLVHLRKLNYYWDYINVDIIKDMEGNYYPCIQHIIISSGAEMRLNQNISINC